MLGDRKQQLEGVAAVLASPVAPSLAAAQRAAAPAGPAPVAVPVSQVVCQVGAVKHVVWRS